MLKDITLPLNTSPLEFLTVSFFIAVGYSVIYKYSFYFTLGIEWYVYSLSPSYIVFSSIKILVPLIIGILIGYVVLRNAKSTFYIILATTIIFIIWISVLKLASLTSSAKIFSFAIVSGFTIVAEAYLMIKTYKSGKSLISENILNGVNSMFILLILFIILGIPISSGVKEAETIKNLDYKDNIVHLVSDNSAWKLIEINGDKALLMKYGNNKKFKIVEYKEIKDITLS